MVIAERQSSLDLRGPRPSCTGRTMDPFTSSMPVLYASRMSASAKPSCPYAVNANEAEKEPSPPHTSLNDLTDRLAAAFPILEGGGVRAARDVEQRRDVLMATSGPLFAGFGSRIGPARRSDR